MASGQTALSLSDLPFMYSVLNLSAITIFGIPEDFGGRFIILGIIAGIAGTFLVYLHPIQWSIDKKMLKGYDKLSIYYIENPNHKPKAYDIRINEHEFRLSLKSSSIKYLKDKFASRIYFTIIVGTFSLSIISPNIRNILGMEDLLMLIPLGIIVAIMGFVVGFQNKKVYYQIEDGIEFESLYNQITRWRGSQEEKEDIRRSIDLQEWEIVESKIDIFMRRHWNDLAQYAAKAYK